MAEEAFVLIIASCSNAPPSQLKVISGRECGDLHNYYLAFCEEAGHGPSLAL
jgi:hypothetical protein